MLVKFLVFASCLCNIIFGQYNLDYFVNEALNNSPQIKNYNNLFSINNLQSKLDEAQNSAFQVYLTSDVLFSPYFNNNGHLISTDPNPDAFGYDVGITNGGEYSALINIDKNIFNGHLLNALKQERIIQGKSYKNKLNEEQHSLNKQVTDQYINARQYLDLYNLSKEIENNVKNQLKITGDLVTKGIAKMHDYLLLKVELKTQQINVDQTWRNYKNGLLQLYSLCGIKDTQIIKIDSVNLQITGLISGISAQSEFLSQYYLDSLSIASQQKSFETKYFPQVKLFLNAGLNAVQINNIQRKFGMSAGINFSLPIFDGRQKSITRQQSRISEKTNEDFRNYARENINIQRIDAWNRINSLRKNLSDYKIQIEDYEKLLDISLKEIEKGNLSMIEYLTELRNYIDIQKSYISDEINYQLEISNYNYWNW